MVGMHLQHFHMCGYVVGTGDSQTVLRVVAVVSDLWLCTKVPLKDHLVDTSLDHHFPCDWLRIWGSTESHASHSHGLEPGASPCDLAEPGLSLRAGTIVVRQ